MLSTLSDGKFIDKKQHNQKQNFDHGQISVIAEESEVTRKLETMNYYTNSFTIPSPQPLEL